MILKNNLYRITGSNHTDKSYRYCITPICDSEIYAAHFPEKPITPGVCLIQMAKELLEEATNESLNIVAVKNVKFLSVLSPDATKAFEVLLEKIVVADKQVSASATILDTTTKYAKISFTCSTL